MDKFLLAENPLRPEKSGLWIIHMIDPISIYKVTSGHVVPSEKIYKHYQYRNTDGDIEEWTLSVYHFFTTDFLEEPESRATKLMDRAWRWLRAYFEEEDDNISSEEESKQN